MKTGLASAALLAFLSLGFQSGGSGSKEVEITMTNGPKFHGEILSVRDSSIVVANQAGLSQEELMRHPLRISVLPFREVQSVETAGSSNTVLGLFAGMAIGCVGGYAIGASEPVEQKKDDVLGCGAAAEKGSNEMTGAALGGLAGGAVGAIIGAGSSTNSSVLFSPAQPDFTILKNVARYPAVEPDFLKSIKR